MNIINRIWNFKIEQDGTVSMRQKAIRYLAGFFAIMLLLTVVSRAANAMTIPRVSVDNCQKRNIDHSVSAKGTIDSNSEQVVSTVGGLKIQAVKVQAGTRVDAGTPLLELDMQDLDEKIRELEIELETTRLEIADAQHNKSVENNRKGTALKRARDDYQTAVANQNALVDRAYQEMVEAQQALEAYRSNPPEQPEEQYNESTLAEAFHQKQAAYQDAVRARDEDVTNKQRAVEDASVAGEQSSQVETAQLKLETAETKLAKYYHLRELNGVISAPSAGVITTIDESVCVGGTTPETKLMLISDEAAGFKFTTQITKEQQKHISIGDEVVMTVKNNETIKDLKVDSLTKNKENPEMMDVTVLLPASDKIHLFDAATMKISSSSKAYSVTIPKEALHKGSNGESDYVYVLEEQEGVLGKQYVAQKVDVTVVEQNTKYAALQDGELVKEQKIVVESSQELEGNDRVRMEQSDE